METISSFNLVGGITRIVVFPAGTSLPTLGELGSGSEVIFDIGGASYKEEKVSSSGQYAVKHTLTFSTQHGESPFETREMEQALRCGVIADVTLSTGAAIRVGVSDRYGEEYPLRLQRVEFVSGESATDYPLKSWVWETTDRDSLI